MDNYKNLSEELLKNDGIDPANIPDSERKMFEQQLDKHLNSGQTKALWRIIMKSKITKIAASVSLVVLLFLFLTFTKWNNNTEQNPVATSYESITSTSIFGLPSFASLVHRSSYIVRGIIKTIEQATTNNLQNEINHYRIKLQVEKIIFGNISSQIITVDTVIPHDESVNEFYKTEQEVIWYMQSLETNEGVIYQLLGQYNNNFEEQEKAIQKVLSQPAPNEDFSKW